MLVVVEVVVQGDERPPIASPIRVEVRDTSLADAPARTVGVAEGQVRGQLGSWVETVEVEVRDAPPRCTVWALVDADRDGRVSRGDFVTQASFPVEVRDEARVAVTVRRVS